MVYVVKFFFSIWVFFHELSQFMGQQGKGEGIYLTPFYHFHLLHTHFDISGAYCMYMCIMYIFVVLGFCCCCCCCFVFFISFFSLLSSYYLFKPTTSSYYIITLLQLFLLISLSQVLLRNEVVESFKQGIQVALSTPIHHIK